jgi:hypothetical protein
MAKTLTQAQRRAYEKLCAQRNEAWDAVWNAVNGAAARRTDVPFGVCLQMCDASVRQAWEDAFRAKTAFEEAMVTEGRAWRDTVSFGMFTPY